MVPFTTGNVKFYKIENSQLENIYDFYLTFFFCLFRAEPTAYGGFQARGLIGAVATGLNHSHSNVGSEPHLRTTPQLMATPDP